MGWLRRTVAPGLGLIAALGLLVETRHLDAVARPGQLGPGFWPRLVLVGLGLACLARIATEWHTHRRPRGAAVADPPVESDRTAAGEGDGDERAPVAPGRLTAAAGLIGGYVLATPWLGFPLTTAVFIAAFLRLAGARSPLVLALAPVGGTVLLLYVFVRLVYLPLPKGAGPFESATIALYRTLGIF
ncbi:MAG TPA: tripartite tricarboxylate transporter TctB family protein [Candidatus Binatia bacterium]|nr:tripartite tricarboxylate transporter TctB family protein [Candidatus Binatia bacterium]